MGGPPTVPQALNRYAATSVGQPGVREAAQHSNPLLVTAGGALFDATLSTITERAREQTLNAAIHSVLASTIGRSRPTGLSYVRLMGEPESFTGTFAKLRLLRSDTYSLPPQGCLGSLWRWLLRRPSTYQIETRTGYIASEALDDLPKNLGLIKSRPQLAAPQWMTWAPKYAGAFVWGGVLNGGIQYLSDYQNPYLTSSQLGWRTGIAFGGGGGSAVIAAMATAKIGAALGIEGGLPLMAIGATAGFIIGFTYFGYIQPVIFNWTGQNPQRNLAPLSSP